MTLKQLLERINQGIKDLQAQAATGADVSAQVAALTREKSAVEARIATAGADSPVPAPDTAATAAVETPEQELERLRREATERQLRDSVQTLAATAVEQTRAAQREQQQQLSRMMHEEVQRQLGGEALAPAVMDVIRGQHGASRFAAAGATPAVVGQLAAGGGIVLGNGISSLAVGEDVELKKLREGKNLAQYMGMIRKAKEGGFGMRDAERRFLEECQQKALAEGTNSAGGFLVHPEWMPDILALLRASAVVRSAGPRIVPFSKEMNQTSISSGATAYYTTENAHIQKSEPVLAEAPLLTPKNLTGLVPVSNYLLGDAPEADGLVRSDLVEVMGLREDLSFLQGTGAGGEPTGMKNMAGRTVDPITPGTGFYMSQPQTRAIRNITRTFNSQNPRWVWFFAPQFLNHLEGLTDADGRYLADSSILTYSDDGRSGVYDGVPFRTTTQIPVNLGGTGDQTYLILVDVNELIIGENQALELAVSTEASYTPDGGTTWISAFQATQTLFRSTLRHDIAHRRPNHVVVQNGVRV